MNGDEPVAILADAGIDFSIGELDNVDLVQIVRRTVPLIEQSAGDIPDRQIRISRKRIHREGKVGFWRRLGNEFLMTANDRFRLIPGNESAELVEGGELTFRLSDQPTDPSATIELTVAEIAAIVDATDHVKAAEDLSRKKSR